MNGGGNASLVPLMSLLKGLMLRRNKEDVGQSPPYDITRQFRIFLQILRKVSHLKNSDHTLMDTDCKVYSSLADQVFGSCNSLNQRQRRSDTGLHGR